MKVLKHITAGLLHLEVLGRVPDTAGEQKRRGGRSAPTSMAQQFYNDKCSWRELELTIGKISRPWIWSLLILIEMNTSRQTRGLGMYFSRSTSERCGRRVEGGAAN